MSAFEFLVPILLLLITFSLQDIAKAAMKIARLYEERERRDSDG